MCLKVAIINKSSLINYCCLSVENVRVFCSGLEILGSMRWGFFAALVISSWRRPCGTCCPSVFGPQCWTFLPITGFLSQSSCLQFPTCCAHPLLDAIVAALICTWGAGWEGDCLESTVFTCAGVNVFLSLTSGLACFCPELENIEVTAHLLWRPLRLCY